MMNKPLELNFFYVGPLPNVNRRYTLARKRRTLILSPSFRDNMMKVIQWIYPQIIFTSQFLPKYEEFKSVSIEYRVSKILKNPKSTKMIDVDNFIKPITDVLSELIGFDDKIVCSISSYKTDIKSIETVEDILTKNLIFGVLNKKDATKILNILLRSKEYKSLLYPTVTKLNGKSKSKYSSKNSLSLYKIPALFYKNKISSEIFNDFQLSPINLKSNSYFLEIKLSFLTQEYFD